MIPAELQACERELRGAIGRCQYDDVGRLMDELRRTTDQVLKHSPDGAARREITGWILATIEWARLMIVTQRQSWTEEMDQLPQVGRFLEHPGSANQEFCLDL